MIPKLRVWDTVKKAMHDVQAIVYTEERVYPIYSKLIRKYIPFGEAILMQSTGLFDTNCLDELFDGDVIYWKYYDSDWSDSGKAQIIFKNGSWKLLDVKTNEEVWDNLYVCLENCNVFKKGNIYENPELLESVEE